MFDRCNAEVDAIESPIGFLPKIEDLDLSNLELDQKTINRLFDINIDKWVNELNELNAYFKQFADRLPQKITEQLDNLNHRLMKETICESASKE